MNKRLLIPTLALIALPALSGCDSSARYPSWKDFDEGMVKFADGYSAFYFHHKSYFNPYTQTEQYLQTGTDYFCNVLQYRFEDSYLAIRFECKDSQSKPKGEFRYSSACFWKIESY